eukprot:TRINITY_DN11_c0_g1_i2.p2 TRINITY_DN11_c0_g1~~TRINITY_DN11_c0_g1_i2.p2  ORF type:complete len:111 (-),score=30.81 TRINITY_DN11_c0_g1_i2:66-362(-)
MSTTAKKPEASNPEHSIPHVAHSPAHFQRVAEKAKASSPPKKEDHHESDAKKAPAKKTDPEHSIPHVAHSPAHFQRVAAKAKESSPPKKEESSKEKHT